MKIKLYKQFQKKIPERLSKLLNKIRSILRDLILQQKLITEYLEIVIIVNNHLSLIITRLILSVIYYNAVFCYLKSPQCDVSVNSNFLSYHVLIVTLLIWRPSYTVVLLYTHYTMVVSAVRIV